MAKPKRPRTWRQPLPDHLPRIEHRHEPESCHCEQCGKDLVKIGQDITEQLDVEPAKLFVHRHIRPNTPAVVVRPLPPHRFHLRSLMVHGNGGLTDLDYDQQIR